MLNWTAFLTPEDSYSAEHGGHKDPQSFISVFWELRLQLGLYTLLTFMWKLGIQIPVPMLEQQDFDHWDITFAPIMVLLTIMTFSELNNVSKEQSFLNSDF